MNWWNKTVSKAETSNEAQNFITTPYGTGLMLSSVSVTVMPPSQSAADSPILPEVEDATNTQTQQFGTSLNLFEMATAYFENRGNKSAALSRTTAVVDVWNTWDTCTSVNECYIGKPSKNLPDMGVINQDVLVSATDFAAPIAVGVFTKSAKAAYYTDEVTSALSAAYNVFDGAGLIENWTSVGFSLTEWKLYILIYPNNSFIFDPVPSDSEIMGND